MVRRRRGPLRAAKIRFRAVLRRLDREAPEGLRWITPWGWSLALHAVFLVVFGALVFVAADDEGEAGAGFDTTVGSGGADDLSALPDAELSSAPVAPVELTAPPAHSLVPDPKLTLDVGGLRPLETGDGPGTLRPALSGVASIGIGAIEPPAPFSGRSGDARARLVRREGGTPESERSVELGLDWLARHQRDDGGWTLDCRDRCRGKKCEGMASVQADAAATGLGLLPMLGAGHSHREKGRYQLCVQRAIDKLVASQRPNGDLAGDIMPKMYAHAIASMALCEAYGLTRDERLRRPSERAVAFIVAAQDKEGGGWRYSPNEPGDTSVFGWQMLALRSAQLSGIAVPKDTLLGAAKYLDSAAVDAKKTTYAYQPGGQASPVMSAEALLIRQYLGWGRDKPEMTRGASEMADHLFQDQERNIYYTYYATQTLHNLRNARWKQWNPKVRNGLVSIQVGGKGCDRGSWDPRKPRLDHWGTQAGRHYTTALSILTLEVYYRYLPLYRAGASAEPASLGGEGD